ncbi:poly(A) RNA polymerase, mitochondrial-like isoform X2 [Pseudomyrmex gracilis]|uniref:poly(A) RNA polymerase, mitochondrial-like isoform X2 n=1 Tax=Pseudomyrmex gracilis TaxID=219809 RepID=UPI000994C783|nr:poly(A) RNA polymerase, mitochondrial-like isoform X2 [Pseudomyrmex gracilis]
MALLGRVNVNTRWLSYCYCKFSTGAIKLKSRGRATSISSAILQDRIKEFQQKGVRTSKVKSVFDVEIANRRNQACRSILVQVYSINSQNELYDYCAQFGEILSMHHYHIDKQHISGQIIDLYEALKLTDLEIRLRFHTACHLEQYVSRLFQNMRILPFGSSINGFGRKRCDLDLVLLRDETDERDNSKRLVFHSKPLKLDDRQETKEFLAMLANSMYYFIPGIQNVRRILEARVPIIKFHYEYTHIECDLSVTNMTGIYMSELLNIYGEIDWRVRPLVTVIRKWAKNQKLTSDSPGPWITNFPLSLLVLFYLQQKNILPSLKQLRSYSTTDDIRSTDGINCTFLRDIKNLPPEYKYKSNQDSLETLLYGFFEYYARFNFQSLGICIREGVPIRKPSRSPLHIDNPLETSLNVCKNVNVSEVNRIIEKASDATYMLAACDQSKNNSWGLMALLNMKIQDNGNIQSTMANYKEQVSTQKPQVEEVNAEEEPEIEKVKIIEKSEINEANTEQPEEVNAEEEPEIEKVKIIEKSDINEANTEQPEIEDYSERYSQEISDKIGASEDDQTKKKEIV